MVLVNQWALLHDPEKYDQPEEFRPERFLDEQGASLSLSLLLSFFILYLIIDSKYVCTMRCWRKDMQTALSFVQPPPPPPPSPRTGAMAQLNKTFRSFSLLPLLLLLSNYTLFAAQS